MRIFQSDSESDEDSIQQFFDRIEQARVAAAARVEPWQAELKPGDHFVRIEVVGPGHAVAIYGEILETYSEPRLEHYRFTRCFSVVMPEGELGDTHVSVMQKKLSPSQFNLAREWGFPSDSRLRTLVSMK